MPAEDALASALEEIRGDAQRSTAELYALHPGAVATPAQVLAAGVLAGTAGKLLAAVEAALDLTLDCSGGPLPPMCDLTTGDLREAITRGLLGEEGDRE